VVDNQKTTGLRLTVRDGAGEPEREQVFEGTSVQVGRGEGNDICFSDPRVSTLHGRILIGPDSPRYQDLGSTNGSALVRDNKRIAAGPGVSEGVSLQNGDEILLGDADRPSAIIVREIVFTDRKVPSDATVVASRSIGEFSRLPDDQTLRGLLGLLADLRIESDSLQLTRRVLEFLMDALCEASRAECYMKDTAGNLAPVLALGPRGSRITGTPPSASLVEKLASGKEAVLVHDTQEVNRPSASIRTHPSRSVIMAPIIIEGEVLGAIQVGSRQGDVFSERDLDLTNVLAQQLATVLSGARLLERLRKAESRLEGECEYLKEQLGHGPALEEMVGTSAGITEVKRQIEAVAPSSTTVLITGETGCGKELVARAIHEHGPRKAATFAAVNCSALSKGLLESELFGHLKGAFTGAHRDRKGLFEVAHNGTLFLDEIGDLPTDLQPKLLRALEEGMVTPVGSSRPRQVDARVVCATNRDLEQAVKEGAFRMDLLYRLNVFTVRVPPLRERREDIVSIAENFLAKFSHQHGREHPGLAPGVIAAFQGYSWPGNVRELKNEMERACLLSPAGKPIGLGHLSERLGGGETELVGEIDGTLKDMMEKLERVVLQTALERHSGNRTRCARALGISRQALISKIARLKIEDAPENRQGGKP